MNAELRTAERHPDAPRWKVTVMAGDHAPVTVTVSAHDEWKARTSAMLDDSMPRLRGEFVDYIVERI
jgi:hypothetical protein